MQTPVLNARSRWLKAAAVGVVATAAIAAVAIASDHMDTPLVEFNPKYDVNDVYAFPATGNNPDRTVLVLGTQSPITPANTPDAKFGDESKVLYQLKVDNTGDGREDLVFQFTFTTNALGVQQVHMRGPVAPNKVGVANTIVADAPVLSGAIGANIGTGGPVQLFAGPRDDPFYIDLEQFFRILPDRRPETGPLSEITQGPLTFRAAADAKDFLNGFNDMAIVVELPTAMLTNNGENKRFGVWGTTSNARMNKLVTK